MTNSKSPKILIELYEADKPSAFFDKKLAAKAHWALNEDIFDGRIFLANQDTGSAYSPLDATDFMLDQNRPMGFYHPDKFYKVGASKSEAGSADSFLDEPKLCYFSVSLASMPLIDLPQLHGSLGDVGYLEILDKNNDVWSVKMVIAPNGSIYVMPPIKAIGDEDLENVIILPTRQEILKAFPTNELIQSIFKPLANRADQVVFNYSIVFCVQPTLTAVENYLQNFAKDIRDKFAILHDPETGIHYSDLNAFLKEVYSDPVIKSRFTEILDQPQYASIKKLVEHAPNDLGNWKLNMPIYFKIDPLAKVSADG